jgi:formylglycine-generating enzyme required for sulfatase activity
MKRRILSILAGTLLVGVSAGYGEWKMRVHHGGTTDEFPVAGIDSVTFHYQDPVPMVLVPAGVFVMGDAVAYCGVDEREATLTHPFYLGRYEVTNQEYRDAVQWAYDHGYVTATADSVDDNMDGSAVTLVHLSDFHCQVAFNGGTFTVDAGKEDYPMAVVSWYGAAAYCDWLSLQAGLARAYSHSTWECNSGDPYAATGYRLPTDAEWEYAAQYDDERIYPWGSDPPSCGHANYAGCINATSVVGSYPAAPASLGLYDMVGNVTEWCNDWFTCDLGTSSQVDPVGPGSGLARVQRGSSWFIWDDSDLRCSARYYCDPSFPWPFTFGFRVARSQ